MKVRVLISLLLGVMLMLLSACSGATASVYKYPFDVKTPLSAPAVPPEPLALLKANGQFDAAVYAYKSAYNPAGQSYSHIRALEFKSVQYNGSDTNVFGYLGFPEGASAEHKVPAVVLVHGGGGTAFAEWVRVWNDAGYAAIAIDTEGRRPDGSPTDFPGPVNDNFAGASLPIAGQWMYHAVSAVIKAHTLIREHDFVDEAKTGICGISWGGIITSIAMGADGRFKFAVPIYGSGYLAESKSWFGSAVSAKAAELWDGSNYFYGANNTEVLFLNSDHDGFFSADITSKSCGAVYRAQMTLLPELTHGHAEGWAPLEPVAFADAVIKGADVFARVLMNPSAAMGRSAEVYYKLPGGAALSAVKIYGIDAGISYKFPVGGGVPEINKDFEELQTEPEIDAVNGIVKFALPESVKTYYVNFITEADGKQFVSSSKVISL